MEAMEERVMEALEERVARKVAARWHAARKEAKTKDKEEMEEKTGPEHGSSNQHAIVNCGFEHLKESVQDILNWNARLPGLNRFINCGKTKDVAASLSSTEDDWEPSCVDDGVRHDTPTTFENVPSTIDRLFGSAAAHGTIPRESHDVDASLGAAATDNAGDAGPEANASNPDAAVRHL